MENMEKHVTLVGALQIAYHGIAILFGLGVWMLLSTVGILSREPEAVAVLGIVGTAVAMFLLVLSAPGLIGGIWLLKGYGWARILLLVVSFFTLLAFPLGTALSVYTFWVLMQDEVVQSYRL